MSFLIINSANGRKMVVPDKAAMDFFGAFEGTKKIVCLPVSNEIDISGENHPQVYEVKQWKRVRKVPGILVIRMGGIGDLVMLGAGLREIIRTGRKVTLATLPQHVEFAKLLNIGNVISIEDMGKYVFDKTIDLRFFVEPKEMGGKDTWRNYTKKDRTERFMELLGVSSPAYRFGMSVPKTVKDFSFCKNAIGINASIMASVRSIPPDYVKEIVDQLKTFNGLSVVLFGKSNPWNKYLLNIKTNKRVINLIDRLTMPEMVSVISKLSLLIAPDSGPLHIAAALRKKTLGLFGNINPATRISHYNTVTALYPKKELDCVPCWDMHPCTGSAEYNPKDGSACMRLLTPDRAVKAAIKLGGF